MSSLAEVRRDYNLGNCSACDLRRTGLIFSHSVQSRTGKGCTGHIREGYARARIIRSEILH